MKKLIIDYIRNSEYYNAGGTIPKLHSKEELKKLNKNKLFQLLLEHVELNILTDMGVKKI